MPTVARGLLVHHAMYWKDLSMPKPRDSWFGAMTTKVGNWMWCNVEHSRSRKPSAYL